MQINWGQGELSPDEGKLSLEQRELSLWQGDLSLGQGEFILVGNPQRIQHVASHSKPQVKRGDVTDPALGAGVSYQVTQTCSHFAQCRGVVLWLGPYYPLRYGTRIHDWTVMTMKLPCSG